MQQWADRLLLVYAFTAPWFFGMVTAGDSRLALTDVLLVPCLTFILLMAGAGRWGAIHSGIVAYGLCAVASILPLVDHVLFPILGLKTLRLLGILAPCLLAGLLAPDPERLPRLTRAFWLGGLLSILYGVVAFEFQWESGTAMQMHYYDGNRYLRRAGGVFQDSTAFGHLLATWTVLAALLPAVDRSLRGLKLALFAGVTLVLAAVGLYASLSRTAMLHLMAAGGALAALPKVKSWRPSRILLIPVLAAAAIVLVESAESIRPGGGSAGAVTVERFLGVVRSGLEGGEALDIAGGRRITTWRRAIQLWEEKPLLGVGYKTLIPVYGMCSDNTLVVALSETGALGCTMFALVVLAFVRSAWRAYAAGWPGGRVFVVLWSGQLIHALTADTITFVGSMSVVLAVSMVLMQHQRPSRRRGTDGLLYYVVPGPAGWAGLARGTGGAAR